jgi:hypothetical protein
MHQASAIVVANNDFLGIERLLFGSPGPIRSRIARDFLLVHNPKRRHPAD